MEEKLKEAYKVSEEKTEREGVWKGGWWDKEREERKREVRKELKRWKKEGGRI